MERYIAVCHPLKGKILCTESRARKVIALVIIICSLSTITTPFEWVVEYKYDPVTNVTTFIHFSSLGKNDTYRAVFYWFTSIVFVFIPLILLGSLNYLLISAVRMSQIKRKKMTQVRFCRNSINLGFFLSLVQTSFYKIPSMYETHLIKT